MVERETQQVSEAPAPAAYVTKWIIWIGYKGGRLKAKGFRSPQGNNGASEIFLQYGSGGWRCVKHSPELTGDDLDEFYREFGAHKAQYLKKKQEKENSERSSRPRGLSANVLHDN